MSLDIAPAGTELLREQHERVDNDFYIEYPREVQDLLDHEDCTGGWIYDPACGRGNVVQVCHERGLSALGSDLIDRSKHPECKAKGLKWGVNFMTDRPVLARPSIVITNPPFSIAEAFIERCLAIAERKVIVLQRLSFLEGTGATPRTEHRNRLLESGLLARVLVFRRRVSCPPGDAGIKPKGGAVAYAWFVFEHGHSGPWTGYRI